jgi:hypothetical protein
VHAFGFFMFQTIYPPVARMGPPPVQIALLTPGTPEADAILRWIDLEDPAPAAQPSEAPIPLLKSLPYIPSYSAVHARPVMSQPAEPPLPYPAGVSGLDLVTIAASHPEPPQPPPAPAATALSFSGPLADAVIQPLPPLDGLREGDTGELQPARFLLGVSAKGEVQYVFIQDALIGPAYGSGDKTLDADASDVLKRVRFRPSAAPLTWGFATFHWGSTAYAQPPSPSPAP